MFIPNIWKHIKCSKPPTRYCICGTWFQNNITSHWHGPLHVSKKQKMIAASPLSNDQPSNAMAVVTNQKYCTMNGWWFQTLWKILVSWDDYSQYGKIKNVPNHQPDSYLSLQEGHPAVVKRSVWALKSVSPAGDFSGHSLGCPDQPENTKKKWYRVCWYVISIYKYIYGYRWYKILILINTLPHSYSLTLGGCVFCTHFLCSTSGAPEGLSSASQCGHT